MGGKRPRDQLDACSSLNEEPPKKKVLSRPEVDLDLARLFDQLSDEVRATRLQAASGLTKLALTADKDKSDKIVNRLLKGLCSSRKAARLGYIIVLTELFAVRCLHQKNESPELEIERVPDLIVSLTTIPESATNQERKDYQLGRCLAFRAFIEGKALLSKDLDRSRCQKVFRDVINHIFALHQEVPALHWDCGSAANQILVHASEEDQELAMILLDGYRSAGALETPEGLSAWLQIQKKLPLLELPSDVWHKADPFSSKDRQTLVHILRDGGELEPKSNGEAKKQTGNASRTPSPAWTLILRTASARWADKDHLTNLDRFWTDIVDDAFFTAKASIERKALGLQVFNLALHELHSYQIRCILSPNLLKCVINQRASAKNNLHSNAEAAFTIASSYRNGDKTARSDLQCQLAVGIISGLGLPNFDKVTRTKVLEGALSGVGDGPLTALVLPAIETVLRSPTASEHVSVDACRDAAGDLLQTLAKQQLLAEQRKRSEKPKEHSKPASSTTSNFWQSLLKIFAIYGYLEPKSNAVEAFSKSSQEHLRTRLMSCMSYLLDPALDNDFGAVEHVVTVIKSKVDSGEYFLSLKADERVLDTLESAYKYLASISVKLAKTKADKSRPGLLAFRLLFCLAILQVYNGDADAVMILEELQECWDAWKSGETLSPLVEILLGFLSRPSALFRKLAEQVFTALAPSIDSATLDSLLSILEKPENASGQRELFDDADELAEATGDGEEEDAESSDSGSSDDDDDASDVELVEANGHEESDDGSDDSSVSDSDDDSAVSADEPAEDAELTAFEAKLAQTLQTKKIALDGSNGTKGDNDDVSSTSDDSDMDDDEMLALDGHLTHIFSERSKQTTKRADPKQAKASVVNFKNRVLDLLAIYVKHAHGQPPALDVIVPLLKLLRSTRTKPVADRAEGVLRALFAACNKDKAYPAAKAEALFGVLDEVLGEVKVGASKAHAAAASRAGLFVVKALVALDRGHYGGVVERYAALQKEWFVAGEKSKVPALVFTEFTSWSVNSRK